MILQKKAVAEVLFFVVFGIFGIVVALQHLMLVWPLIIIYGTMVWKRYASPSLIPKGILPHTIIQRMLYMVIVFLHLSLALSFSNPGYFSILMGTLILFETLAYTLTLPFVPKPAPLFQKIKINIIEALLTVFALVGIFFGYAQLTLIIWSILLMDISIYFILFRKMYANLYSL